MRLILLSIVGVCSLGSGISGNAQADNELATSKPADNKLLYARPPRLCRSPGIRLTLKKGAPEGKKGAPEGQTRPVVASAHPTSKEARKVMSALFKGFDHQENMPPDYRSSPPTFRQNIEHKPSRTGDWSLLLSSADVGADSPEDLVSNPARWGWDVQAPEQESAHAFFSREPNPSGYNYPGAHQYRMTWAPLTTCRVYGSISSDAPHNAARGAYRLDKGLLKFEPKFEPAALVEAKFVLTGPAAQVPYRIDPTTGDLAVSLKGLELALRHGAVASGAAGLSRKEQGQVLASLTEEIASTIESIMAPGSLRGSPIFERAMESRPGFLEFRNVAFPP